MQFSCSVVQSMHITIHPNEKGFSLADLVQKNDKCVSK